MTYAERKQSEVLHAFKRLVKDFSRRAMAISQLSSDVANNVSNGEVADYFKYLASSVSQTAQAVEECKPLTIEEWRERRFGALKFEVEMKRRDLEDL